MDSSDSDLGLGIDAGGTETRWALARRDGAIVASGHVAGMSALQMGSPAGRERLQSVFATLATQVQAHGRPKRICAGLTGFGGDSAVLTDWLAQLLAVDAGAIGLCNDIEIACLDSFAPGEGYLVYAGTGSIAAFIDIHGTLHRAGGRGVVLDDGGGGFWIAREAMRRIWRREDEAPGAWQDSTLARAVFEHVGGSDWSFSRQFIYGRERGEIGQLALAVAHSADNDVEARAILQAAGVELARLAQALVARFGPRPIVLAGRAAALHPLIFDTMRATLPASLALAQRTAQPHFAAARLAARPTTS
ncbi:N-acetylglucosamine kinase [Pseudoduganella chitinolytica]|uniref:BadF/BadG/BcrA/BcrD ATPase family protein n=1 Tax=Pseudoduganella chitinolytica TaxID=34070 RepID=A0ABY8BAP5_9BURK|nr:BadF/BadG/BcrA/BcrD ATPase family protein [Pseudoduganella chitinolytica]WEF32083.1 BadF/BadG/BcrA/BcrD ATPase family protein [Pseudoduganella chitinolytica]